MTARQVLIGARDLIAKGWTRGAFTQRGRYCADGALLTAAGGLQRGGHAFIEPQIAENYRAYRDARRRLSVVTGEDSPITWNDRQRSKKPVLEAFDRAIEGS